MKYQTTYKINKISFLLIIFFLSLSSQSTAQTYIQARAGYIQHRYKALDEDLLDRDEHDYIKGFMIDAELGKEFGKGRFTYLIGGRLQYNLQALEGIYTAHQSNPNAKIKVHAPTLALTMGVRAKIYSKLSALFQANLGIKYTLWYQNNDLKETFWDEHIPLNFSLEYKLKKDWNLVTGLSLRPPTIYTSQTYKYFLGFRKFL